MQSSTLSRTSSAASISSDDTARRTRKRFSSVQLMMLEQLFHQTSHPTREERDAVAQAAGMYVYYFSISLDATDARTREMKSVTIWFQNKRQTERKVALHHATNQPPDGHRGVPFPLPSSSSPLLAYASPPTHAIRPHTRTLSASLSTSSLHIHTPRRKITPPRPRPSLDRIATRSESRLPPPRTPTKPHNPRASLWDNMPSSPLAPPASPPSRDLVEFMGSTRTLEWACAAARLADKEGRRPCDLGHAHADGRHPNHEREGDETEEDDHEAVTPEGSLGALGAARWQGGKGVTRTRPRLPPPEFAPTSASTVMGTWTPKGDKGGLQDDDMMRAALALCGLGRRSA
ncbi:homeobox-domain-containing protein [Chiua virens]|nr:homeobox-domain-containing protein [Chiua virens]KAG9313828.1 homeobox-domain-containing protein [Chiua virens]